MCKNVWTTKVFGILRSWPAAENFSMSLKKTVDLWSSHSKSILSVQFIQGFWDSFTWFSHGRTSTIWHSKCYLGDRWQLPFPNWHNPGQDLKQSNCDLFEINVWMLIIVGHGFFFFLSPTKIAVIWLCSVLEFKPWSIIKWFFYWLHQAVGLLGIIRQSKWCRRSFWCYFMYFLATSDARARFAASTSPTSLPKTISKINFTKAIEPDNGFFIRVIICLYW